MIRILKSLVVATACIACACQARTLQVAAEDTIYLTGIVGPQMLDLSARLHTMAETRKEVNIVINSPGGSVLAGFIFIDAINAVESQGVQVNCIVGSLAASMAFNIWMHCSHLYAFPHSLLLFHPPRVALRAPIKAEEALTIHSELVAIEQEMNPYIRHKLVGGSATATRWFKRHYDAETLWTAAQLASETRDGVIVLIDNTTGINPWDISADKGQVEQLQSALKEILLRNRGIQHSSPILDTVGAQ